MTQSNDAMRSRLLSTTGDKRAALVRALLTQATRMQSSSQLAAISEVLEEFSDWENLACVASAALQLELSEVQRAEWTSRLAWCRFALDEPNLAWEILANGRENIEAMGSESTRKRAYLVSGYIMDVRGLHAAALAWYAKALPVSGAHDRPHVLLEMATSQSKLGLLRDALITFEEALALLVANDTTHERLRVHLLSRSAVVLEMLGDLDEAVRRQTAAYQLADSDGSGTLPFECLRRRARTYLAKRQFAEAKHDLGQAEQYAAHHRRGTLHLTHDWARLELAQGNWIAAVGPYATCLSMLPNSEAIVDSYSDLWSEILDGLETCIEHAYGYDLLALVREAQADNSAIRERSGIYSGQPVRLAGLRARAARSTEALRQALLSADNTSFASAGYRFDIAKGEARRLSPPGTVVTLDAYFAQVIRFLWNRKDRRATAREIGDYLRKTEGSIEENALRKRVDRHREVLGIGADQVLVGQKGRRGGGYRLVTDA